MKGLNAYQETARRGQQDELIVSHLPLVRHVIGRLAVDFPPGMDRENLESAGVLGLVEAARAFDPTRNVQFKTYAYTRIRGAILDELRRNSPLSQQVQEKVSLVSRTIRQLSPPITIEQVAAASGLSEDDVAEALQAMRFVRHVGDSSALEEERDRNADSPSRRMEEEERRKELVEAIEALPPQERLVVVLYYREELRLKEISAVMGLSESRVSRVLSAALLNLHSRLRDAD